MTKTEQVSKNGLMKCIKIPILPNIIQAQRFIGMKAHMKFFQKICNMLTTKHQINI